MQTSPHQAYSRLLLILTALTILSGLAFAADPGTPYPADVSISDQKAGSVLIFNYYSSSASNPAQENTRINITNTNENLNVAVHLFFIDGDSCSPADYFICLTPNQTVAVSAAEFDPGTSGYLIAIAVNPQTGCPENFNYLIGDEYIKLTAGFQANLGAEAVSAINLTTLACSTSPTATIQFNGAMYGQLPMLLAVDNVSSRTEGNRTLLIINSIRGNLSETISPIGLIFGIMYSQLEAPFSFTFSGLTCQVKKELTDQFPRTTPRFSNVIPTGSVGWMKFYTTGGNPITGAALVFNPNANSVANAYNQGHNLHKLRTNGTGSLVVPVFPANCR